MKIKILQGYYPFENPLPSNLYSCCIYGTNEITPVIVFYYFKGYDIIGVTFPFVPAHYQVIWEHDYEN